MGHRSAVTCREPPRSGCYTRRIGMQPKGRSLVVGYSYTSGDDFHDFPRRPAMQSPKIWTCCPAPRHIRLNLRVFTALHFTYPSNLFHNGRQRSAKTHAEKLSLTDRNSADFFAVPSYQSLVGRCLRSGWSEQIRLPSGTSLQTAAMAKCLAS